MNDDDDDRIISSLTRAFTTRRAVLCVGGGFLSFPAGLKNQKCETLNNLYSKMEKTAKLHTHTLHAADTDFFAAVVLL